MDVATGNTATDGGDVRSRHDAWDMAISALSPRPAPRTPGRTGRARRGFAQSSIQPALVPLLERLFGFDHLEPPVEAALLKSRGTLRSAPATFKATGLASACSHPNLRVTWASSSLPVLSGSTGKQVCPWHPTRRSRSERVLAARRDWMRKHYLVPLGTTKRWRHRRRADVATGKAAVGFEPTNRGFAIRSLSPLGHAATACGTLIAMFTVGPQEAGLLSSAIKVPHVHTRICG